MFERSCEISERFAPIQNGVVQIKNDRFNIIHSISPKHQIFTSHPHDDAASRIPWTCKYSLKTWKKVAIQKLVPLLGGVELFWRLMANYSYTPCVFQSLKKGQQSF